MHPSHRAIFMYVLVTPDFDMITTTVQQTPYSWSGTSHDFSQRPSSTGICMNNILPSTRTAPNKFRELPVGGTRY
jgi:hypothetical protein